MNLEIKTRTFDELLSDLEIDLRQIDEEGLIEPATLIKVAQRVNYDLGLRIHQTKEMILDLDNHTAKLPEDFYVLNFALLTGHQKCITPVTWAGRTTENITINASGLTTCDNQIPLTYDTNQLNPNKTYYNNDCGLLGTDPWAQNKCYAVGGNGGAAVSVIEHKNHQMYEYSWFEQLYIKPQSYLDPGSMNTKMVGLHSAEIKNGHLYCSHKHGKIYISYQGALEDEYGNLLVMDHPEINFYYLAALQEYIFKILYFGAGEEVLQKYQLAKQECKEARVRALSIVNMPNFQEMKNLFEANRIAQYNKYYKTFQTNCFSQYFRSLPF